MHGGAVAVGHISTSAGMTTDLVCFPGSIGTTAWNQSDHCANLFSNMHGIGALNACFQGVSGRSGSDRHPDRTETDAVPRPPRHLDDALIALLRVNGRSSISELARHLGIPRAIVRTDSRA